MWPDRPGISESAQPCALVRDPGNKPPEGVQHLNERSKMRNSNIENPKIEVTIF
jgi:hypothetical protein